MGVPLNHPNLNGIFPSKPSTMETLNWLTIASQVRCTTTASTTDSFRPPEASPGSPSVECSGEPCSLAAGLSNSWMRIGVKHG